VRRKPWRSQHLTPTPLWATVCWSPTFTLSWQTAVFAKQAIKSATFEFTDDKGVSGLNKSPSYAMDCNGNSCTVTTAAFNAKSYASGDRPWGVTDNNGVGTDSRTGLVNVTQ
jgi:hypothetical protein